ncbi:hypothetical protein [Synechococcus sp. CCAP 1479/9]|uniref:hypothetical protein n=1 Tax=Synechococcus sp. CCAP 1479/9 TaxID=1221593 RepID=UPI001C2106E1|nr:hypothetical protein [Synechococcus sp. CCAP 1479/9]
MARQSTNTGPIMALVAAEIAVLLAFVGVCELRASGPAICEHRWSLVLPSVALVGQSAATYFMDSGRHGSQAHASPRNARGQFLPRRRKEDDASPA